MPSSTSTLRRDLATRSSTPAVRRDRAAALLRIASAKCAGRNGNGEQVEKRSPRFASLCEPQDHAMNVFKHRTSIPLRKDHEMVKRSRNWRGWIAFVRWALVAACVLYVLDVAGFRALGYSIAWTAVWTKAAIDAVRRARSSAGLGGDVQVTVAPLAVPLAIWLRGGDRRGDRLGTDHRARRSVFGACRGESDDHRRRNRQRL